MSTICIEPLLYNNKDFPLWKSSANILNDNRTEQVSPCGQALKTGDIVQLSATQILYSFDYYQIYSPHTIYSAGAAWYITNKGFTASFDPNTVIRIGEDVNVTGSYSKIRAIYR